MAAWVRVLWRDPCAYCGGPGGTVDHITAVYRGGRAEPSNLTGACPRCNLAKGAMPLLDFLLHHVAARGREPRGTGLERVVKMYNVGTMATRLGIRELRDKLPAMMRRVRDGEVIEVTHHGVPIAVISPVEADRIAQLIARGDVIPAQPLEHPIEPMPVTGPMTATEALMEERDSYYE